MDMLGISQDAAGSDRGGRMRYKVGAEQLEQVPSLAHRPDGVFRSAGPPRSAQPMRWTRRPVPSPAGARSTGSTCWTTTGKRRSLPRSAPGCFAAAVAHGKA